MGPTQELSRKWSGCILGIRVVALFETVTLLAVALSIDTYLLDGNRFAGIQPHPFWAAVLLAAAQYGTKEGLAAAVLATAALLAGALPEQGFGEDLYAWLLRISGTPVLWFIAAVVLGEIRDGHHRKSDMLKEELADTREQARTIAEAYERLAQTASELEVRVAGQVRTVHAMYTAARAIERQDTREILIGVAPLVQSVLGPLKFSLYLLNGQRLELAAAEGWTAQDCFTRDFNTDSPLFHAIVDGRQTLTGITPEHEFILQGEGMLAGPLASRETGKVVGMLKFEEIAFAELNPSNVQNFSIVCDWIGTAYDSALRFEQLRAESLDGSVPTKVALGV
jgi:polysaccharide biosynthesis protein PelD